MLLKAFEFALIAFGITIVVGFVVAAIIKAIGATVQKMEGKSAETKAE
jgi:hypothetical protein